MSCCHHYALTPGGDAAFAVDVSAITFGPGCLREAGDHAASHGMKRVALFTDPRLSGLEHLAVVRESLKAAGLDVVVYDEVKVGPPTPPSWRRPASPRKGASTDSFRWAADR